VQQFMHSEGEADAFQNYVVGLSYWWGYSVRCRPVHDCDRQSSFPKTSKWSPSSELGGLQRRQCKSGWNDAGKSSTSRCAPSARSLGSECEPGEAISGSTVLTTIQTESLKQVHES
jgi:hypothetical protein